MLVIVLPVAFAALVLYQLGVAVYNVYFHPLAKFPGPKLWIAFPFLRHISGMRGDVEHEVYKLHEKYGEVVRHSDNEITFTTAEGWRDVYGHGRSLPKYNAREVNALHDIILSDNAEHTRYRKALAHGFSEKGLRGQEPIIRQYVDDLMIGLREEAVADKAVDLTMWYNCTTFDVISDLAFGKSFDSLKAKGYNEHISAVFEFMQAGPSIRARRVFPLLWNLTFGLFCNKSLDATRAKLRKVSKETAMERAYDDEMAGRGDFMDSMMKHRGGKDGLTDAEIGANANILLIAGSETTATLLSGISYHLLKTPEVLAKVTNEVRSAFNNEDEIDFMSATQKLPYMLACLEEALRIYPPVPGIFSRVTQRPTEISGYMVPAGTLTGVHQISSYWTERNFYKAKEFIPERWLKENTTNPSSPFYNDKRAVFQPFSFGPRNCLGRNLAYNEMRMILARLLFTFDLEMMPESKDWEDQKIKVLWCKHPLMCKLRLREKAQ